MKKLFVFILILALLIPAASPAEDLSAIVGVWISTELTTTGAPSMSYIYLAENHRSYFIIQMFHEDSPGVGRQFVGAWQLNDDGTVFVETGNNTSTTLTLAGDYSFDQKMTIYLHAPTLTLQDLIGE